MEQNKIYKKFQEYLIKYDYPFNFHKNKLYLEEDVKKDKKHRYFKVLDNEKYCYVRLPFLTRKMFKFIAIGVIALLIAAIATPIGIIYMPHNVTLTSETLNIESSNIARRANDYKCSFKIKDDVIVNRYMDNIDFNNMSVTVNNKVLPSSAYSFIYQTNAKNELTIQKKYLTGNIDINIELVRRSQKHNCFFFEYDIEKYASFDKLEFSYPTKIGSGKDTIDGSSLMPDNIILKNEYDIAKIHNTDKIGEKEFQFELNTFIAREDNAFKVTINANDGMTLPKNIWFRTNARYARKDVDFTINYSSDYKKATIEVPYFVIRDNGSIRLNPDVEA